MTRTKKAPEPAAAEEIRPVIYARVSSEQQRDRHTIASQISDRRAALQRRGWPVVDVYIDDGFTAKAGNLDDRKDYARLMTDMGAGRFNMVSVVDVNRLTRSEDIAERGAIIGAFQKAGVKIHAGDTVLDLRTSQGDLFAALQSFFAAEDNRKRSEAIRRAKQEGAAQGKPANRPPYGYTCTRRDGWKVVDAEAAIVREIYARIIAGERPYAIERDLIARAIPRRGKRCRKKPVTGGVAGLWRGRVIGLVEHPIYRGEAILLADRDVRAKVPLVVSEAIWKAAQDKLAAIRGGAALRAPARTHVDLLAGVAVCGICGSAMWAVQRGTRRASGKIYRYYSCMAKAREGKGILRCPLRQRPIALTDEQLRDELSQLFRSDPRQILRAADQRNEEDRADAAGFRRDLAELDDWLTKNEQRRKLLAQMLFRGSLEQAEYERDIEANNRERDQRRRDRDIAAAAIAAANVGTADLGAARATLASFAAFADEATPEEWRELVRILAAAHGGKLATFQPDGSVELRGRIMLGGPRLRLAAEGGGVSSTPISPLQSPDRTGRQAEGLPFRVVIPARATG